MGSPIGNVSVMTEGSSSDGSIYNSISDKNMLPLRIFFCWYIPKLAQFWYDIVIVLTGKHALAFHQYGVGDTFIGFLGLRIMKAIPYIESIATLPLFHIIAFLPWRFHVENKTFVVILADNMIQYLLTIAFAS